jgi:hypothetical protein
MSDFLACLPRNRARADLTEFGENSTTERLIHEITLYTDSSFFP